MVNKGDKSPDGNHNLTSHSNTNENKTVNYPRNKLTRMARTRSNSDDNIVVNDTSSEIHISICDHDSGAAVGINGFKFPSSHQEYINALHHNESNNILNDMKRTSSDSNIDFITISLCYVTFSGFLYLKSISVDTVAYIVYSYLIH
jgi:hypothetical protein